MLRALYPGRHRRFPVYTRNFDDEGAIVAEQAHGPIPGREYLAPTDSGMSRGQFLTAASIGVGGIMGALIAAPVAGMALGPVFGGEKFEPVVLGKLDEFKDGEFVKVVLHPHGDKPDAYVRKKVAFVRRNKDAKDDSLALDGQEEFSVVSNVCMHLGCPVQASNTGFVCPCHGGSYNKDGARQAGPPVRPLDRYKWEKRGDELWATDIYALKNDGGKATHRDPGQHTSGLESWFYPLQP
ncbi:MAG: Rieske (2Fe-2S) iron-sulfur domain protein [Thermoleophilia bacterium]|nr:Rieske (2Fe-2S) iron-sulfur domain protein [Thermoleophilia bacterium]